MSEFWLISSSNFALNSFRDLVDRKSWYGFVWIFSPIHNPLFFFWGPRLFSGFLGGCFWKWFCGFFFFFFFSFPRAFLPWPTLTDYSCACRLLCCFWGETWPWLWAILSLFFLFALYLTRIFFLLEFSGSFISGYFLSH